MRLLNVSHGIILYLFMRMWYILLNRYEQHSIRDLYLAIHNYYQSIQLFSHAENNMLTECLCTT